MQIARFDRLNDPISPAICYCFLHDKNSGCWIFCFGPRYMHLALLSSSKIQQTKMLVTFQWFDELFFIWAGLAVLYQSEPI